MLRIVRRHLRATLAGTNRHPGLRRLIAFLHWSRGYYVADGPLTPAAPDDDDATNRADAIAYLAAFSSKIIHCCTARDVAALARQFTHPGLIPNP